MHPTVEQNQAHRNSSEWIKSNGRSFDVNGEHYLSEYVNAFTGKAIRKGWKMTGQDWYVFDAAGNVTSRAHTLTWAKMNAAS